MRVLISAHDEISHWQPLVPLSWALRSAGHQVLAAVPASLAAQARALGLDTAVLRHDSDVVAALRTAIRNAGPDAVPVAVWPRPDQPFWRRIATRFADTVRRTLPDYLAVARDWAPDLIICDPMEASGQLAAGCLGIPVVQHRWGIDVTAGAFSERLGELLDPDARELGLPGLPPPDLIVDPCPLALQRPGIPAGRRVRYVPSNGFGSLPDWARRPATAPRICVTMGTKVNDLGLRRVARWVFEGIAALGRDVEVVLAMADLEPSDVAAVADRVIAAGPVPLGLVLDRCALVVHHGGQGTGLSAAVAGVPQLALPQFVDQFAFAEQAEACGIGIGLGTLELQQDPIQLRDALDTLLTGARHRAAARGLAEEIRRTPPPSSLVPELERLAARRRAAVG